MISAQSIAEEFLLKINQENNEFVPSWQIAQFFNTAQSGLWRRLVYDDKQKPEINASPRNAFQDSSLSTDLLLPFQRIEGSSLDPRESDPFGFIPQPEGLAEHTLLSVYTQDGCKGELVRCQFVRDQEFSRVQFSAWKGPRWPGRRELPGDLTPYHPIYTAETSGPGNVPGYRIYPQGKYFYELRYLIFPPDMAISNQAGTAFQDEQLFPPGSFVNTLQDVDLLWPPAARQELINRATSAFAKSTPDYQQYQVDTAEANQLPN